MMAWKWFFMGLLPLSLTMWLMLPGRWRPKGIMQKNLLEDFLLANQYHLELMKGNVIDAGANKGVISVFAARMHPDAVIYAFEPSPETFKRLRQNTGNFPNIKIFNAALGGANGTVSFVTTNEPESDHIGDGDISIEIKTIDSLGIPVDFIKIDTEGWEAAVLNGAKETIKKYRPTIVMSAYHKPNDKVELPAVLNAIIPYNCKLEHRSEEDLFCTPI